MKHTTTEVDGIRQRAHPKKHGVTLRILGYGLMCRTGRNGEGSQVGNWITQVHVESGH